MNDVNRIGSDGMGMFDRDSDFDVIDHICMNSKISIYPFGD